MDEAKTYSPAAFRSRIGKGGISPLTQTVVSRWTGQFTEEIALLPDRETAEGEMQMRVARPHFSVSLGTDTINAEQPLKAVRRITHSERNKPLRKRPLQ
jgi:hypothetical protein